MTTTSRKFSTKPRRGGFYSFLSAMKAALLPGGLLMLLSVGAFGIVPLTQFASYSSYFDYETGEEVVRKASDFYKFLVFMDGDETLLCYLYLAIAAVVSVLVGVTVFRFTSDKRTVNVYYSLGIRRSSLFYSRYLAGALVLCAAYAVAMIVSYAVNLIYVGASWQLSVVLLYYYCGLSLFSLLVYTVTAAVFACTGTVSESVLYSVCLLALPSVALLSAQNLISAFLENSVYGLDIVPFALFDNWGRSSEAGSLIADYAAYNPVLFFSNALIDYSVGRKTGDGLSFGANDSAWHFPSIGAVLPWFLVVVVLAVIAGSVLFRIKKAENCGFLNTNKVLSTLSLFELMFFVSTLLLSELRYGSDALVIFAVSAGLATLIYVVFEIFLERSVRLFFRRLWKLPAVLAVIALIFTVFSTGLLGYESYLPDEKEVESVAVSLPVTQSTISFRDTGGSSWSDVNLIDFNYLYWFYELPETSDRETIRKLLTGYENSLKSESGKYRATVAFRLKNEKIVRRSTLLDDKSMRMMLTAFDAPEVKQKLSEIINCSFPENPTRAQLRNIPANMFRYENAAVTAISNNMLDGNRLNLTKEEFEGLKQAILTDLTARTAESYFGADKAQLGILSFQSNIPMWMEDEEEQPQDTAYDPSLPKTVPEDVDFPAFSYPDKNGYRKYDVLVDESMTNTLSFLQSIGAGACFEGRQKIKSISFRRAEGYFDGNGEPYEGYYSEGERLSRDYYADSRRKTYFDSPDSFGTDNSENFITDGERIAQLSRLMRLHAFTYDKGYYCLIICENGDYSTAYLPESIAPEYVKNYAYTK